MEGFTIVDGVVAAVIVLSALLAYSRGLVREALAIGGWIVAGILAFMFVGQVQPLVKEIPMVGQFVGDNCVMSLILAFAALMTVALVVMSLFTPFFASLVQRSVLGGLDQALGFFFGVARGIVLVAVTFFVYEVAVTAQDIPMIDDSRSAAVFAQFTDKIDDQDPEQAVGWIEAQYQSLLSHCDAPAQ
ncbi:CvpA family protein [Tropicibacter sp. R15_0]|uniref:CvpA family protein n=1 Tax=Tropicibacter sp. R15_0 TaxID=2821101 RepID=UPI001AD9A866|nr:CvpA family protein [Tropicibacter sp. R15_0]MBO9464956.1 CvpA family protein [Tropicibacter sp. R15_0]